MVVLPDWLDQIDGIDFSPEKDLLGRVQLWAEQHGWIANRGENLPAELRQRTDVLLEKPDENRRVRLAVLRKAGSGGGEVRVDSSDLITVELIYQRGADRWLVEIGGARVEDDLYARGLNWLFTLIFAQ
jgi:hypothetical protein